MSPMCIAFNVAKTVFLASFSLLTFSQFQSSYAQQANLLNDAYEQFNIAAAKHSQELNDLRGRRALPPIYLHDLSVSSIAHVLSTTEERHGSHSWSFGQALYPENTSLLFYSYSQEKLHTWLLGGDGIKVYHQREVSEDQLYQLERQLRNALGVESIQSPRIPYQRAFVQVASSREYRGANFNLAVARMTNLLIPEVVANELKGTKHLIVVPVLNLGTIPYPILRPFNDNSFLVDHMSVSIAPSLFDIGADVLPWDTRHAFHSPLIVGNPYLPESPEWVVPPLPGAQREAEVVAELLGTEALVLAEATKEEILSRVTRSTLLYFATHGIANTQDPLEGGFLMFSASTLEQGWWTAREIQETGLHQAQIAVLSACQTGLGGVHDAGIIGVARAFQIAGVRRVVMSLWNVDDEATSNLMQAFMRHLETTFPSEALRLAMLETRAAHANPSDWASFVLFGSPR
jgi:CHAT domain-containing protein